MKNHHPQFARVLVVALLLATTVIQPFFATNVAAGQITTRRLTLQAGALDGGSKVSGNVNHFFEFTVPSTTTAIGSIKFEYCTTAANSLASPVCIKPSGVTTTAATLGSEAGSGATGFSIVSTTDGAPYLTKATPANPTAGALKFRIDHVINPDFRGTFYVRITTYTGSALGGTATDTGTVAASTAYQIILDGTMPESLVFCVGADIIKVGGVVDCSTATSGGITFNQLFSPISTASAVSRMAASTNAGTGYIITVNGPTLVSGGNSIAGLATPTASQVGVAQFGLNLRANTSAAAPAFPGTSPLNSADIDSVSNVGLNLNGRPTADYGLVDTFKFLDGDPVADSNFDNTASPDPTNAQIYTVSYIANVPGSQPAGNYVSTLTYICTPTY